MTEEENESIEFIKSIININKENKSTTTMLYVSDVDVLLNLVEKTTKENEDLKEKVLKKDKKLIRLEEYANKNFERKDDVKARYISKDKIKELFKDLYTTEESKYAKIITIDSDKAFKFVKDIKKLLEEEE